ncbi:LysR family transcriptional regulator [Marinobacter sp.]|uniref:LysR family transcriptional regulator n=1 Tax=Marinobacter sp. TaxID=50741 RepID=UPI003A8E74E7
MDLNLLISLDALLAERNVTKAAARLNISQPALSAQLAKLRVLFDDPLLLPADRGRGMIPTSRALSLQAPLRSALGKLDAVVQEQLGFDPKTSDRRFQIALGDNATQVIGLPLVTLISQKGGPGIRAAFSSPSYELNAKRMEEGEIDLLIDVLPTLPGNMKMRVLLEEPFVMAQRKNHPRGQTELGLDDYCELRHVIVAPEHEGIGGFMDAYLTKLGRKREIGLKVPQFLMVPEILLTTDFVCTLPRSLLHQFEHHFDVFDLPFQTDNFVLAMAWHPRIHADPGVRWLRDLVTQTTDRANAGPG